MEILKKEDYLINQFLLSPNQLGIPNSRLRYYLIATNCFKTIQNNDEIITNCESLNKRVCFFNEVKTISEFLEFDMKNEKILGKYYIDENILSKEMSKVIGKIIRINRPCKIKLEKY